MLGCFSPGRSQTLDRLLPTWRGEDTRFGYQLVDDWTEERMASYLSERIDAYDAGTLDAQTEEMLDRTMSDWRSDAARIFCGRTPPGW